MSITKIVHNVETNEIQEIELTAAEINEMEARIKINAKEKQIKQAEAAAKAQAKAQLLAQLGITEEQAKLLLS